MWIFNSPMPLLRRPVHPLPRPVLPRERPHTMGPGRGPINKRIKFGFGVTVALIISRGHQSTIRSHLAKVSNSQPVPTQNLRKSDPHTSRRDLIWKPCIARTYTKYF
jgi:hypothetical protein